MSEKQTLPSPAQAPLPTVRRRLSARPFLPLAVLAFLLFTYLPRISLIPRAPHTDSSTIAYGADWTKCPSQPKALFPETALNLSAAEEERSIELFQEAVSFDDNGEPNEDPRWAPFFDFQKWLEKSFPTAWSTAKIEFVNTLGILATFEGSDPSLKPLLLMSHYDVTPAPASTYDRWTHPPFSGHNDGEYIWGRGAGDDKTLVVAQWEAITHLLEADFKPRRTLILSHGFDEEEVFARRGQGHIAPFLEERYGNDGLLMVIDEGGGTQDDYFGTPFALPGMGEKGYLDIQITVGTAGGHSSVPPVHTGIGIMSMIVLGLEDNQFENKLTPASPILTAMQCAADHAASFPKRLAKLLKSEGPNDYPRLTKAYTTTPYHLAEAGTTTAVDVVNGGAKINALPELVTAGVNFRIDFSESVASTQAHIAAILGRVAKKNGLAFSAWNKTAESELGGRYVKVEMLGLPIEPAPRTPAHGGVWELFAGTVKAALPGPNGEERIVAPYASTGNTDCKMYYNLTKNVYRFLGGRGGTSFNAHTVDERASVATHLEIVHWVHAIVQNADAYDGDE